MDQEMSLQELIDKTQSFNGGERKTQNKQRAHRLVIDAGVFVVSFRNRSTEL